MKLSLNIGFREQAMKETLIQRLGAVCKQYDPEVAIVIHEKNKSQWGRDGYLAKNFPPE